jgi:hypothetical protein
MDMKRTCCLALGLLLSLHAAADPAGQQVLACARRNLPPTESIRQLEMVTTDRNGVARTVQGKVYTRVEAGQPSALSLAVRFEAPRDLSGAAYLVRQARGADSDQMYMFLPALQRVRRINGNAAGASLLGTSFSYADFRQIQSAFGSADATLEGSAEIGGRSMQVLAIRPATGSSPYSLIRSWVDRATCVPMQAEFYVGTALRKRFEAAADALRQSGRYWYLADAVMHDIGEGSTTRLRFERVSSGDGIPSGYFLPGSFYLAN